MRETAHLAHRSALTAGSGPRSLAIADIDEDGQLDIVTPDFFDFTVSVLFNNNQASAILHTTINVTATNDAPQVTAPTLLATAPSAALSLKGVVFADVDGGAAGQTETATFTAALRHRSLHRDCRWRGGGYRRRHRDVDIDGLDR